MARFSISYIRRGMVYSDYQWVIIGNTFDEVAQDITFTYEGHRYECFKEEMKTKALNGAYFLKFKLSPQNESAATISGYSFNEYEQILQKKIEQYNSQNSSVNISYSSRTTHFYDSLWAWLMALDRLAKKYPSLDLGSYRYGNYSLSTMLLDEFYDLDFNGVSGRVNFSRATGFVQRTVSLFQVVDERLVLVAEYYDGEFKKVGPFVSIPDQFERQITTVNDDIVVPFLFIAVVELLIVIALHILTVIYRSRPSVKAASFWLSQLIYLGCYFNLLTSIIFTVQNHSKVNGHPSVLINVIQNLSTIWFNPIWYTLILGSVGARTWRLYRIFVHYLNLGPLIANKFLLLSVFSLVFINMVISTVWTAIDPFQPDIIPLDDQPDIYIRRWRTNSLVWHGLVTIYGGIVYMIVALLAFLTRKIQSQSFSTKTLRVFAYLSGAIFFLGNGISTLFDYTFHAVSEDIRMQMTFVFHVGNLFILLLFAILLLNLPPLWPVFREVLHNTLRAKKKINQA